MSTNKEILIGYINTLSEAECGRLYLILRDDVQAKETYYYFNNKGERVNGGGSVALTPKQFNKLYTIWGSQKFKQVIALQGRVNEAKAKRDGINKRSDYLKLLGWTEKYYYKLLRFGEIKEGVGREDDCLNFSLNITLENAKKFISLLPSEVRDDDTYCLWLFDKFGGKLYE